MMPSALSSDLDSSVRLRIPRKKAAKRAAKRAEPVREQVPGLDNQTLDVARGGLLLREGDLLSSSWASGPSARIPIWRTHGSRSRAGNTGSPCLRGAARRSSEAKPCGRDSFTPANRCKVSQ